MPYTALAYRKGPWSFSGHMETVLRAFKPVQAISLNQNYILTLRDGDFVELHWYAPGANNLVILTHGLEGSASSGYMVQLADTLTTHGYTVLAWSMRGCGLQLNDLPRAYHSGETMDLDEVVKHAEDKGYKKILLVGFSLGGNITLKYMGEMAGQRPSVAGAVAISVPCDLASAAQQLTQRKNLIYHQYFLRKLKSKLKAKAQKHPELRPLIQKHIRTLVDFDEVYTGPIHGFESAAHYYHTNSANQFLAQITKPTILLNALNDPLLTEACFPIEQARLSAYLHLITTEAGGHVAFTQDWALTLIYYHRLILDFFAQLSNK